MGVQQLQSVAPVLQPKVNNYIQMLSFYFNFKMCKTYMSKICQKYTLNFKKISFPGTFLQKNQLGGLKLKINLNEYYF